MNKKPRQVVQPARPDGWYWIRLFVPLRGGHYHHSWEIARVEGGRVQLWESDCTIPITAPVLMNARWSGPIDPPLDEPPRTVLALEKAGNRQKRKNQRQEAPTSFTDAEKVAVKIRFLAAELVDVFVKTPDLRGLFLRHPEWRKEVVDRLAGLLEQAFGGHSEEP